MKIIIKKLKVAGILIGICILFLNIHLNANHHGEGVNLEMIVNKSNADYECPPYDPWVPGSLPGKCMISGQCIYTGFDYQCNM